jgi:predicted permease
LVLGAGRARIVRQLITEHVVLAVGCASIGLLVGWSGLRALRYLNLQDLPRGTDIQFDARTVVFTFAAAAIVGVLLGLITAIVVIPRTAVVRLDDEQRSTTVGKRARRLQRSLVVSQVAIAFVLLIGAGLLFSSFRRVLRIDLGFETRSVVTATVSLPGFRYREESQVRQFVDAALARIRAAPSVTAAGVTDTIPFGSNHTNSLIVAEGHATRPNESFISPARVVASPGYFEAVRARLIAGRLFDDNDVDSRQGVAIVDQTLAARFWSGASPIGRRLYRPENLNNPAVTATTQMFVVVGVIAPMKLDQLVDTRGSAGAYFFPVAQQPARLLTFAIRSSGDPTAVAASVRAAIQAVDRELPVFDQQPMDYWTARSLASRRAAMLLSVIFSAVAIFLAAVGVYGVLAYLVAQRRKEIGIRLALGATTRAVFGLVMREGIVVTGIGLGLGALGLFGLERALQSQLFEVTVTNPIVLIGGTALVVGVAAAACAGPAWRASRINPRVAMSE